MMAQMAHDIVEVGAMARASVTRKEARMNEEMCVRHTPLPPGVRADHSFAEPLVDHEPCGSSAKSALPLGSCSCRSSGESMCAQESSTCESIGP